MAGLAEVFDLVTLSASGASLLVSFNAYVPDLTELFEIEFDNQDVRLFVDGQCLLGKLRADNIVGS